MAAPPDLNPAPKRLSWRGLLGSITAIAIFGLSLGYVLPLLSLMGEARGDGAVAIGFGVAAQYLGLFVMAPLVPKLLVRPGIWATMIGALASAALVMAGLSLFDSPGPWMLLRFLFGAAEAALFIAGETWINESIDDRVRGRIIGLYTTALAGGIAIGPLLIMFTGTTGAFPLLVGAGVMAGGLIPLVLAVGEAPVLGPRSQRSLWRLARLAPLVLIAAAAFGFMDAGALGLLSVYGLGIGLDAGGAARLVTVLAIGGLVFQTPIGWLADRLPRPALLGALAGFGAIMLAVIPLVAGQVWLVNGLLFFAGGVIGGLWTMAMVLMGSQFSGGDFAAMNVVATLLFSAGGVIGPAVMGPAMAAWPPHGLMAVMVVMLLAVAGFSVLGARSKAYQP